MRHWILEETNYGYIKENPIEVALLPTGATEPHNLHMPYGTDNFQVIEMASRACEAAYQQGAKVVMLPNLPYGTETNMMEFPFAMNLNPSTILQIFKDLIQSLEKSGIKKLLILNGHGGNGFKPAIRELSAQTNIQLFLCDWMKGLLKEKRSELFEKPGDHADEVETSLGLAFFSNFIAHDSETGKLTADEGSMAAHRFDAVEKGYITISRPWHKLTTNSGAGNPHAASAEKGEKLMQFFVDEISSFLVQLANSDIDETFPFE
ncbi:Creatinine amidohydrolase [hydrothermal vent metagenome]|uniref:Creatinine amidohydrolase n=1 Tax=hydrothermal vent metagenome TaxID=652676 RepID=A0A3B1D1Z5_9ZZZZ